MNYYQNMMTFVVRVLGCSVYSTGPMNDDIKKDQGLSEDLALQRHRVGKGG